MGCKAPWTQAVCSPRAGVRICSISMRMLDQGRSSSCPARPRHPLLGLGQSNSMSLFRETLCNRSGWTGISIHLLHVFRSSRCNIYCTGILLKLTLIVKVSDQAVKVTVYSYRKKWLFYLYSLNLIVRRRNGMSINLFIHRRVTVKQQGAAVNEKYSDSTSLGWLRS